MSNENVQVDVHQDVDLRNNVTTANAEVSKRKLVRGRFSNAALEMMKDVSVSDEEIANLFHKKITAVAKKRRTS